MKGNDIIPHLFKTEYSKLVAVLTKTFGLDHIEIAEDIASETFLSAIDSWPYKGVPKNPVAWLYAVAKNKVKNELLRNNNLRDKIAQITKTTEQNYQPVIDFSNNNIADSQLQMLFTVCHPSISAEAQICLALRVLCGLGIQEIADAFLSNKETIHKRLQRAKRTLKLAKVEMEMPGDGVIKKRLDTVLQTIYLLFSEGYYSESNDAIIRAGLCIEALNLTYLLLADPLTNTHATNALMSLMCFQSSRLEARTTAGGHMTLYDDQDRSLWDSEFVERGFLYLQQASKHAITSKYYLEASIAYWHTVDNSNTEKWTSILSLYDVLLSVERSPVVALNRIWAFSKVHGDDAAIIEVGKLDIQKNHFYFILLGALYKTLDPDRALNCLINAQALCKGVTEKAMITERIKNMQRTMEGEVDNPKAD